MTALFPMIAVACVEQEENIFWGLIYASHLAVRLGPLSIGP